MEFDLDFMTLMSVFFKNSFWVLWLLLYRQSCSLLVTASDSKHINGKILSSFTGFLYQALIQSGPFAHKVLCYASRDFSVPSGQHFWVSLCTYSHSSLFSLTFTSLLQQKFFFHIIFFKMQFQKGCRIIFFFLNM